MLGPSSAQSDQADIAAAELTIAIPCLLLAALYNARVERYFREIDESLMDTMP